MELFFSVALHGACTVAAQQYSFAWLDEVVLAHMHEKRAVSQPPYLHTYQGLLNEQTHWHRA
jgi:hypothetical protein